MDRNIEKVPFRDFVRDKRILVVGLGKSGIAASQVLSKLGGQVTVQDIKKESEIDPQLLVFLKGLGIDFMLDRIPSGNDQFNLIVLSPGVNPNLPWIQEMVSRGAELTGELEIAYRVGRGKFVAITGTNGKTTTTTLVGEIFKASGRKTHVVGNIGVAVISEALETEEDDWLITETSSFQLETTKEFQPEISVILNLTPDHLDRHETMEKYGLAKSKVFENQTPEQITIINRGDDGLVELAKSASARVAYFGLENVDECNCFVQKGNVIVRGFDGEIVNVMPVDEIKLVGKHNLENVLAAVATAYFAGISTEIIRDAVGNFSGVEHRIEPVAVIDGAAYFNDSKGTNVDATVTALKALEDNIILIAGGDGKDQDFRELAAHLQGRVKALILLGKDKEEIARAAEAAGFSNIYHEKSMDDCVRRAAEIAVPGDKVLLSPACASWDMYDNYEQRGLDFKECVYSLER